MRSCATVVWLAGAFALAACAEAGTGFGPPTDDGAVKRDLFLTFLDLVAPPTDGAGPTDDASTGGDDMTTPPPDAAPVADATSLPDSATLPDFTPTPDLKPPPDLKSPPDLKPPPKQNTGGPCSKSTDCLGTSPTCITTDSQGHQWPGGYCTSKCNPNNNDPQTGLNSACPGGAGWCVGSGTSGACYTACDGKMGKMPCTRGGYSCFVEGCLPTSLSECDPTVKGSCNMQSLVCVPVGPDPVGQCLDACDPFAQDCPLSMNGLPQGCYATLGFGEGICSEPYGGGGNGAQCSYLDSCNAGYGCHLEGNVARCRPYCGGPNNVSCKNGLTCKDLSSTVKKATIGVCGL